MRENFKVYTVNDSLVIENPSPYIRAEIVTCSQLPEIKNVYVKGTCKISDVKRILKRMTHYLEKNPSLASLQN